MTLRTLTTSISIEARENSCDANYASLSGLEDPFPGRGPETAVPSPLQGECGRFNGSPFAEHLSAEHPSAEPRVRARIGATIARPARNALRGKVKPDIEPAPPSTSSRAVRARIPAAIGSLRHARHGSRAWSTFLRRDALARSTELPFSGVRTRYIDAALPRRRHGVRDGRNERNGARPLSLLGGVLPPFVVSVGARARVAIVVSCAQVRVPRERSRRSASVSGR